MGPRLAVAALLLVAACDGAVPRTGARTDAIRGGTAADDDAVVAIGPPPVGCQDTFLAECSGVVIGDRAVLTAAHCAEAGRLAVFVGPDVAAPGAVYDVALAIVHPDLDLAVLVLATPVDVTPLALAVAPADASDVGRDARAVGFGAIDETGAGIGVRREGTSVVDEVGLATFRTTPGPGMTCPGDSGGPVLIDRGDGEVIAGITSSGDLRCEAYADNVDVGAARAFVDEALATAAAWQPGAGLEASCTPGCESDDDCAFGLQCEFLVADDPVGRCALAPLPPGGLDGACASDDECGSGTCARVPGADACRCHVPCDDDDGGGCAAGGEPSLFAGLAALALLTRRRRGRAAACRRATPRARSR